MLTNPPPPRARVLRSRTVRTVPRRVSAMVLAVVLIGAGCSQHVNAPQPQNAKPTTPVSGVITVDGKPGFGVQVTLVPAGGIDVANPTVSVGEADKDGRFRISTYGGDDGAPPGEYTLTFQWFDRSVVRIGGGDPKDMFQGKYATSSPHKLTVPEGPGPFDAGTIELSSK